jgi:hypothetical protein
LNSQAINPSKFEVWWKIALNNNKWRGKRTNYSLFHSRKPSCIWIDSNSNLKSLLLGFVFMGFNQYMWFLNETTQNCNSLLKEEGWKNKKTICRWFYRRNLRAKKKDSRLKYTDGFVFRRWYCDWPTETNRR